MRNYHAKLEIISGLIRIYDEKRDDSVHNAGIPFLFSVFIRWVDPEEVEIIGLSTKLSPEIWKKIACELHRHGVKRAVYYRYKDGKKIRKTVSFRERWLTE